MKKTLLFFIAISIHFFAQGQIQIKGKVLDSQGIGIVSANIKLQQQAKNEILAFCITDKDGTFSLKYSGTKDSLQLIVACFNYEKKILNIKGSDENLNLTLNPQITQLKEVKIQKEAITRKSDTLIFNVASFASKKDRSIGDVIAKLPGIEMDNGTIKYDGKPISIYYTQNKNLLGQQYQMANESIGHTDVDNVSIMKNHQPIKALQGEVEEKTAAININLKKSALNKPHFTIRAGTQIASKELTWDGSAFVITIGDKKQSTADYQTNNIGNTVRDEIARLYEVFERGVLSAESTIGNNPSKKDYYFLFNNANAVKTKFLLPVSKKQDVKIETFYLNDHLTKESASKTTYFLPDNTSVEVLEPHRNIENKNQFRIDASLTKNLKKDYLSNKFSLTGVWRKLNDQIYSNPIIQQQLGYNNFSVQDHLQWVHTKDKKRIEITSQVSYTERPEYLSVQPSTLFKNKGINAVDLFQEAKTNIFDLSNYTTLNKKTKLGDFSLTPKFNLFYKKLNSQLYKENNGFQEALDTTFSNHFESFKASGELVARNRFKTKNQKLTITTSIPLKYEYNLAKDAILNQSESANRFYVNFSTGLEYFLGNKFNTTANYSFSNMNNGLLDTGYGSMMINYRMLTNNRAADYVSAKNTSSTYNFGITYSDAATFLTVNLLATYTISNSNQLLAQTVNPGNTINTMVRQQNQSVGRNLNLKINKYFEKAKTSIGSNLKYYLSTSDRILENQTVQVENQSVNVDAFLRTNPYKWLESNYSFGYIMTNSSGFSNSQSNNSTRIFKQNFSLSSSYEKWTLRYELESNYVQFNKKRYNFSDATLLFKANKKYDFSLTGRNLANIKTISSANYINNTLVISSYELRPISVIFGVSFYL